MCQVCHATRATCVTLCDVIQICLNTESFAQLWSGHVLIRSCHTPFMWSKWCLRKIYSVKLHAPSHLGADDPTEFDKVCPDFSQVLNGRGVGLDELEQDLHDVHPEVGQLLLLLHVVPEADLNLSLPHILDSRQDFLSYVHNLLLGSVRITVCLNFLFGCSSSILPCSLSPRRPCRHLEWSWSLSEYRWPCRWSHPSGTPHIPMIPHSQLCT